MIFDTTSERCVAIDREALRTRKKKVAGRLRSQQKVRNDKCSHKSLRDFVLVQRLIYFSCPIIRLSLKIFKCCVYYCKLSFVATSCYL